MVKPETCVLAESCLLPDSAVALEHPGFAELWAQAPIFLQCHKARGPGGPGGPRIRRPGRLPQRIRQGSGLRGRGRGPGRGARGGKTEDKEWIPVTKLGCLVKDMKIKSLEETGLFFLPIKESPRCIPQG
ncbi:hypothetical protein A6R68_13429 [Neotoma lepida]|uniref:Uncharacterized protein n=1 Tax=Neotoma lepida TaxID=56216 RepID=A0A1A6H307_NEOLE|nr:hypothetical protein A6R68_13429 [Neotoma lepida]